MASDPGKFWMVWAIGGGVPIRQHRSRANAEAEASRLARSNAGITFVVLEAVRAFTKRDVEIVDLVDLPAGPRDPDLPF